MKKLYHLYSAENSEQIFLLGLLVLYLLGLIALFLLGLLALFLLGLLALEVARPRGCLLLMPSTAVPSRACLLQRPNLHSLP